MEPRILRRREVEQATQLSKASIYRQMHAGDLPQPVKLGERAVGWKADEIAEWLCQPRAGRHRPRAMSALEALHERGAHFVLCRGDKRPVSVAWQETRPGLSAVEEHAARGLVGVIPGSVGCVVVDVDEGGDRGLASVIGALGAEPIATVGTRSGGFHLWYPAPAGEIGNRKWGLSNAAGDIRGSRGFVVCWDPAAVVDGLAANFAAAPAPSLRVLPKPSRGGKRSPEAVRAAKPGARNDTLNREAFLAAARGELDEDVFRDAAAAAGLAPGEVEATLGSAARAGAEKAPRVVPHPSSPMAVARALAAALFTSADGALTLRHHRGCFYRWDGRHWPVTARARRSRESPTCGWSTRNTITPRKTSSRLFNPTRRKIDALIDALKAVVMLDSAAEPPCWIDGTTATLAAEEIVSAGERAAARPDAHAGAPHAGVLQPSLAAVPLSARVRPASPVARLPG